MNKNLLSFAILTLAGVIIIVNLWKPSFSESNKEKDSEIVGTNTPGENPDKNVALSEGSEAPDFELTTLNGKKARLSDYRGKKVILNFWATWCPPCKAEMPHMQKFYEQNKDKGIEVVAVNLTSMDKGMDVIEAFVKEYGLTFPILLDESGDIGPTYDAFSIPTSYIIDTKGIITNKIVGPMDEEMMNDLTSSIE